MHFLHPRLDERVAGLPHLRPGTRLDERLRQHLGALHVEHHRRAGAEAAHRVAAVEHEELVAEEDLARLVHRADAVGVAIERDAELGAVPPHLGLQVAQVLGDGRVGMMVREGAVRLAEERRHLGAELAERLDRDDAARAIAAIDHHAHRSLELVPRHDGVAIARQDGAVGGLAPAAAAPALGDDRFPERDDVVAVHRAAGEHHLEAVELGRVVRAGHLAAAVDLQFLHRRSRARAWGEGRRRPRCRRRRRCPDGTRRRAPGPTGGCRGRRPAPARDRSDPMRRSRTHGRARVRTRA